jgi:hypothetical protein
MMIRGGVVAAVAVVAVVARTEAMRAGAIWGSS